MVTYKKVGKGRLSAVQRQLLNDVNKMVRELPKKEQKSYEVTVNNDADLQKLFNTLKKGTQSTIDFQGEEPPQAQPSNSTQAPPTPEEKTTINPEPEKVVENQDQIIEQIVEPKTVKMTNIPSDFQPLSKPTVERSYNVAPTTENVNDPIPEPNFDEVPGGAQPNSTASGSASSSGPQAPQQPSSEPSPLASFDEPSSSGGFSMDNITNPAVNELDEKEKRVACKQLVDTVLDAYEMAHTFAGNYAQMDENKLMQKVASGEIDPNVTFPVDEKGTEMNAIEFFQNMNEQSKEALAYDPEFGDKVRPAMQRVFMKKGWGFSDEQYLMYMFGKDIAVKTTLLIGMKKTQTMMLNMFIEMKQGQMAAQQAAEENVTQVTPDAIVNPPKNSEPQEVEILNAEEVEAEFEQEN